MAASLRIRAIAAFLVLASGVPVAAGNLFDPAHRYQTVTTEHFVLYFHQGEDALAARLANVAEDVWRQLASQLATTPPPLTHLVLADETEAANGWATPLPYDTVMVTAARPGGAEFIGNTDDWFRLVLTHEFTHIVQLDQSVGWARTLRTLFGRSPLAFPNLFLPQWQIEGLATYEEGARTGDGRPHAGDFRAIQTEAARAGLPMPLDRVNGGLGAWPAGLAPYAYGLGFHAYLAGRYGESTIAALAGATAGRVPYTTSPVFRRIYGRSLGELWREYQGHLAAESAASSSDQTSIVRVTHHGYTVLGPRFVPSNCDGCSPEIVYSLRGPHAFPSLNLTTADGRSPRRLTTRYLGSTAAVGRQTIYFDQVERRRNAGLYSDLYTLDRKSGHVRRLTSDARLLDPDLSPDERTLAAVRSAPGRRDLVLLALRPDGAVDRPTVLASAPETQFAAPRWSPDGRTIAAERQTLGARSEIVTVDVASGTVRVIGSAPETRFVTPTWRPDGAAIVAAAASNDQPFNLVELDPWKTPDAQARLSPDARDRRRALARCLTRCQSDCVRRADRRGVRRLRDAVPAGPMRPSADPATTGDPAPDRATRPISSPAPYTPWPTLRPTSWSPVVVGDSAGPPPWRRDRRGRRARLSLALGVGDLARVQSERSASPWRRDARLGHRLWLQSMATHALGGRHRGHVVSESVSFGTSFRHTTRIPDCRRRALSHRARSHDPHGARLGRSHCRHRHTTRGHRHARTRGHASSLGVELVPRLRLLDFSRTRDRRRHHDRTGPPGVGRLGRRDVGHRGCSRLPSGLLNP